MFTRFILAKHKVKTSHLRTNRQKRLQSPSDQFYHCPRNGFVDACADAVLARQPSGMASLPIAVFVLAGACVGFLRATKKPDASRLCKHLQESYPKISLMCKLPREKEADLSNSNASTSRATSVPIPLAPLALPLPLMHKARDP